MSSDREYMRQYMKRRYYERKRKALALLGGKCAVCGSKKGLEFDHIDPATRSFVIGKALAGRAWAAIVEELKKCQLLCQEHHTEKSCRDRGLTVAAGTHGTLSAFRYCKCAECKEAKRKWSKQYNERRRAMREKKRAAKTHLAVVT